MEVILNINNLQYQNIFQNITLSLEKSKIITVSGPNNSGKTTLCRILDRRIKNHFNINLMGKDIKDYSLEEYNHLVQVIYPNESYFHYRTLQEMIENSDAKKDKKEWMKKEGKSLKLLEKDILKCSMTEKIWLQIMNAILKSDEIVVNDNLDYYLDSKEEIKVYDFINRCSDKFKNSFIMTTTSLERAIDTDTLYIIQEGEIVLHGAPLTVLQNDNMINKAGLDVPFMIDLCVKLRDYELIKYVELDKERLVDALWN